MAERVDDRAELAADDLAIARPPVDHVRMAATRARAEQLLFGNAQPAKIGRYVLLGGQLDGGMGVVYTAYDPDLHRKVALKVLHPRRQADDSAHERLIAEARALARLDHPNVVKVHDVISQDGQVVIVMEWIDGTTLAAWESERRPWRDVVAVYLQAGHGLAAAHGVGVVHRDFKPANVIVGADGRVRVLDFGLARPAAGDGEPAEPGPPGPTDAPALGSGDRWAAGVTATGDVVGTPAYAAPEQLAGEPATPASDQFSFGVALHRALEGVPPFTGDSALELLRSIRAGQITTASDPRVTTAWLRSAIVRSLAADPAARFPSMSALLGELARPRGWRRWRVPLVVTACVLIAAIAVLTRPGATDPLAACDGGGAEIGAVWNPAVRAGVDAAFTAIASPSAQDAHARVLQGVDGYRDRWTTLHRDACVAHRRGEQSAALLDRRMLCLQHRLGDLRASVAILQQLDATSAAKATDVVARMPAIADCGDLERLEADTEPPATPAQRAAVDAVRAHLSQAAALDRAGRSTEALTAATATADEAERTRYPPVVAEAALLRGRILMSQRDLKSAATALGHARTVALEHGLFAIAVEAAARQIYVEGTRGTEGTEQTRLATALRDASIFLPLSQGIPGDHFARPLLLNNLGTVAMSAHDRARAAQYFQDARAALAGVASPDLELVMVDKNLAMVTADARTREELARNAWQRLRTALGETNLSTLEALYGYSRYVVDLGQARSLVDLLCADYDRFHPELTRARIECLRYQAFLAGELGDPAQQIRSYEAVAALAAGSTDPAVSTDGQLATGYLAFLRGDRAGATAAWQAVVNAYAASPVWWVRLQAAPAQLGLGLSAHSRGNDREAERDLERAVASYREAIAMNEETEYRLRIATAERILLDIRHLPRVAPPETRR